MEEDEVFGLAEYDGNRLVLSASSMATFLRCGKQWEFAYVHQLRIPPTVKQSIGIAAHGAWEENLLVKMSAHVDLPEEAVVAAFTDEYDRLAEDFVDPDEDPGAAKDQGVRLIQKHHRDIAPGIIPLLVEQPVKFEINGIPYTGTLDYAHDLTDPGGPKRVRVGDWKTSARKPSNGGTYSLGMTGYALGYRHLTGETEALVQLDYLVRYKRQDPAYYPIPSDGPVSDRAIAVFADTVAAVYEAIQANRFLPNGLSSGACSWCGFRKICPHYGSL